MYVPSYSKIYALGHKATKNIFDDPVVIQEKIDGSQISFGVDCDGILFIRSKRAEIISETPGMFLAAVEYITHIKNKLKKGFIYRGEYLSKPKHNTLAYDRTPNNHIMIFDIMAEHDQDYVGREELKSECERLGFEPIPEFYNGLVSNVNELKSLLERESVLGGAKIEGFVIKNYNKYDVDKKVLMAKYVSEAFKEIHERSWKKNNPTKTDLIEQIIEELRIEARWHKAIQHLNEEGKLEHSPRDIGLLMKEIQTDTIEESEDYIKDRLYKHYIGKIRRGITAGFPEWYKDYLIKETFETE